MPTTRSKLSEKNPYHINKDRYLELKHFCAQIPLWNTRVRVLQNERLYSAYPKAMYGLRVDPGSLPRPTEIPEASEEEKDLMNRVTIFRIALNEALPFEYDLLSPKIRLYFYQAICGSESYDKLAACYEEVRLVPRDKWYEYYRKFFFLLDKSRK